MDILIDEIRNNKNKQLPLVELFIYEEIIL
ncbi:hypothetical protein SAMN05443252_105176 [Bacillus sp. OV322]|nr:hypothetical protein SAMN05443252_105176 [Bacillus sp. OV322]